MKKIITIAGICCALPLIVIGFIWLASTSPTEQNVPATSTNLEPQGEEFSIIGREHVPEGIQVTNYNSNPPTSGDHWPEPANWGFYTESMPDERLVHNLEHGGVWISYKGVDDATREKLNAVAEKYPQAVIVTSREENDTAIALASWGRLQKLDVFDEQKIDAFVRSNINNSPEPLASLEQLAVKVGNPFPSFMLTEVDGTNITNNSLKGKPAIVWFTTEFCVPCQIGARIVSQLDDELGGDAFDVLVIFVDPRETDKDLINWRDRFANSDWMVAFDNFNDEANSLSAKVGLQYLDSKYLLDKDGIIQNIDFAIANEAYLNTIRRAVESNE